METAAVGTSVRPRLERVCSVQEDWAQLAYEAGKGLPRRGTGAESAPTTSQSLSRESRWVPSATRGCPQGVECEAPGTGGCHSPCEEAEV